jgi:hypothetical protein
MNYALPLLVCLMCWYLGCVSHAVFISSRSANAPVSGEKWVFNAFDESPWQTETYKPVIIIDVQDGWVRYDMGQIFNDERMRLKSFTRIYKRAC